MNRDVFYSLRNRASPFWAVLLTALWSNGIVFGNWLQWTRQRAGVFYFKLRYADD